MLRHRQLPTERDLAALADGSLPAARRVRVERAVAASPELQAIVASQRRALAAIEGAAGEQAPAALRARLELLRGPRRSQTRGRLAGLRRSSPSQARVRPRLGVPTFGLARVIPAGAVAAAAVVAVLVVTLGGGVTAPTVAQASVLATRPAVAPAPSRKMHGPTLEGVSAAGLQYPYWDDSFRFRAVGVRHDRLNGRPATTVFYQRGTQRIAYTIVSGAALRAGAPTARSVWNGVEVRTLRAHGMRVVTWLREGHSCVLSGRHVPYPMLMTLAAWKA